MNESGKQDKLIQIIVVLVGVMVLVLGLNFFLGNTEDTSQKLARVVARQNELIRIAKEAKSFDDSFTVSKVLTDSQILFSSTANDIESNFPVAPLTKEQLAEFTVVDSKDTLTSASKEDRFTEAFVELYSQQLDIQQQAFLDLYNETSNQQLKDVLDQGSIHIATVKKQLEKL